MNRLIEAISLYLYKFRREMLKILIPEFFWPKFAVLDGVEITVRGMPYSFGVKRILVKGEYESSERILMGEILQPGDVVYEYGGSIGILATIAAIKIGDSGMIVSVEASERLAAHTRKRLAHQNNVKILTGIGYPVWQAPERYKNVLFVDHGNSLGGIVNFPDRIIDLKYQCDIYDIKSISDDIGLLPTILLIDIEGSEVVLLEKNISVPLSVKHIVIELHPNLYGSERESEIVSAICKQGFRVVREVNHVFLFSRTEDIQ